MSNNQHDKLPLGWAATTLGEITRPSRLRVNPQSLPGLPFIGLEHVESNTMRLLGTAPAQNMRSSAIHFFPGDVLYSRLRPYLNKVYCPDFEGLCSAEFIVFPASNHFVSKYLQFLLNSADFVSFTANLTAGDRPRVDYEQLSHYPVWLAPLQEQQRIVAEIEKHSDRLRTAASVLTRSRPTSRYTVTLC